MKILKSQRGSILIELVLTCFILNMFVLCTVEVINIIRADIYIQKIAREGAREASMTNNLGAGKSMAEDAANQYFASTKPSVTLYTSQKGGEELNVVCDVTYVYRNFYFLGNNGLGGMTLNAKAVYPWWEQYT